MSAPATAMVLAAGLGTRLRPLTLDRPKALVEVGGKTLIDHMLDRLESAGVVKAVVNVHAFADLMEAHLLKRSSPSIIISDERTEPLETAGGLKKALPVLGPDPVWVANIDSIWIETGQAALEQVARSWDPSRMDVCLMLAPTHECLGFHDSGDVFLSDDGQVRFKEAGENAPYVYVGVHICDPSIVAGLADGPQKLLPIWKDLARKGRVSGTAPKGLWMHVGDPQAHVLAEAEMARHRL